MTIKTTNPIDNSAYFKYQDVKGFINIPGYENEEAFKKMPYPDVIDALSYVRNNEEFDKFRMVVLNKHIQLTGLADEHVFKEDGKMDLDLANYPKDLRDSIQSLNITDSVLSRVHAAFNIGDGARMKEYVDSLRQPAKDIQKASEKKKKTFLSVLGF